MNPNNHNTQFAPGSDNEPELPGTHWPPQNQGPAQTQVPPTAQPMPSQPQYGPQGPSLPAPAQQQPGYQPAQLPQSGYTTAPEQQYNTPPPPGQAHHQQYDFIMQPGSPRRSASLGGGGSKTTRIAIVGGGIVVLLIAASIFMSVLNKPKTSTTGLVAVAQQQAELIRVAGTTDQNAVSSNVKNLGVNLKLSLGSDSRTLLSYMTKNNLKVDVKTLALKHSKTTDTELASAIASSTYDSTFNQIIQKDLASYAQSIKTAYNANPGPKGKALLTQQYANAQLLMTQAQQP